QDASVGSAIEKRAPLLEFLDAVGSFRRMKLGHAPVVHELAAAHGVAEMCAPIVGGVHVAHGRGDSAFGHNRVGFAEERFANETVLCAVAEGFDGSRKACTARADDQYIMFVSFVFGSHRILMSRNTPLATMRT